MAPSSDTLADGRYRILEPLGQGGMATVYRALDERLQVQRAVKILSEDFRDKPRVRARFEAEAKTMAVLDHPNIVRVYDVGNEDGTIYIVMELVEGQSLFQKINASGALSVPEALSITHSTLEGLAAAHQQGIIHRDIKPHNILISDDGRVRLADFGIARGSRSSDDALTKAGAVMGTWAFMAPEQRADSKAVDYSADIYGMGATMFTMVTTRTPVDLFAADHSPSMMRDVPACLEAFIRKATRFNPAERYLDVSTMLQAVEEVQADQNTQVADALNPQARPAPDAPAPARTPAPMSPASRARPSAAEEVIILSACSVDLTLREVVRDNERLSLTEIETALLEYLLERDGIPASREELLQDVWGYAKGVITRAVDNTVMRLRQKIEEDPRNPDHLRSIRGLGYRLELPEVMAGVAVRPTISVMETHLPRHWVPFIGRTEELNTLEKHFSGATRLGTVLGPGGMGKTRLARRFAVRWVQAGHSSVFCDLTDTKTALDVCRALARVLAIELGGSLEQNLGEVGQALEQRGDLLIVLDNFEQLGPESGALLAPWMKQAPKLRILVTSRTALGLPGEAFVTLKPLSPAEGATLFRARAEALGTSLKITEDDETILERIVGELDGLPLAIELAATRSEVLPPAEILHRLQDRFKLLADKRREGPDRQATLRATIAWSWDLLKPLEQEAWRQLSVFSGGFSLEAAEAVVVLDPDAPWVLDILQSLCDQSLLQVYRPIEDPDAGRYQMLVSIQAFGKDQLQAAPDGAEVWDRHLAYFAGCARKWSAGFGGPKHEEALAGVSLDLDNLIAAHSREGAEDLSAKVDLLEAAIAGLIRRGPWAIAHALLDETDPAGIDDAHCRARLLLARGQIRSSTGLSKQAVSDLDHAADAAATAGDERLRLTAVCKAASGRRAMGEIDQSREALGHALEDARKAGLRHSEGIALKDLGALQLVDGHFDEGRRLLEQSLTLLMEEQDLESAARTLAHLGQVNHDQAKPDLGCSFYQRAIDLQRTLGNRRFEAIVRSNLALALHEKDQLKQAEAEYRASLEVHRAVGNHRFEGFVLGGLGMLAHERGDLDDAAALYKDALALFQAVSDSTFTAIGWARIGAVHLAAGRDEVARQAFATAREAGGDDPGLAWGIDVLEGTESEASSEGPVPGWVRMARRLRAAAPPQV